MRLAHIFFVLALTVSINALAAQDDSSALSALALSGSLRGASFSAARTLNDIGGREAGSLWLRSAPAIGDSAGAVVEGWVRNEDLAGGAKTDSTLRESYVVFHGDYADLKVGKQIIVWGRADKINPTDNLTPRNYTLLTPEDDDLRLGTIAANLASYIENYTLSLIWLPQFIPNVIPVTLPSSISVTEHSPNAPQGAVKLDRSGGVVDWSMSYYNGMDLNPDLEVGRIGAGGPHLSEVHHRIQIFGVDAATVVGRYGLRGEFAYVDTKARQNLDSLVKSSYFSGVVGGDRTLYDYLNINVQYYFEYVSGYQNPQDKAVPFLRDIAVQFAAISNQRQRYQDGISVRVSDKWFNETLTAEVAAIASMSGDGFVLRPKATYAINDPLKLTVGMDIYRGDRDTFWGRLEKSSLAYAELKFSF